MIPLYDYDKALDMLKLGYTLKVSYRLGRSSTCITNTNNYIGALGRVTAEIRNRLIEQCVLIEPGTWRYDYSRPQP